MENEREFRDVALEVEIELLDKSRTMDPGTEKHSRTIEDIVKLEKARTENYKVECEMYHDEVKLENDIAQDEKEVEIKKLQVNLEDLKSRRTKANNILLTSVFGGLSVFGFVWEYTGGHIIPGKVSQMMSFIPKAIKL